MSDQTASSPFVTENLEESPPAEVVESILAEANRLHASDIYVLCQDGHVRLALRRQGRMQLLAMVSEKQGRQIANYIRAMAGIDIGDQLRAGDGRWAVDVPGDEDQPTSFDLRVNSIPTQFGMDVTCRLLRKDAQTLDIDKLGLLPKELGYLRAILASSSGLILVTGPTGSGKTTTLYACIRALNDGSRKINTIEDPIEYSVNGVCQSQVNERVGMDFPELLRNILRQAPDVILIGEVRDEDTAKTAVRAANSGHLVFATLHARTAAQAVQSLNAYDVNPFFLSSCLRGVIAQRLVRRLHEKTRLPFAIDGVEDVFADVRHLLEEDQGRNIYGPNPEDEEFPGGYDAQTGVFEVLLVDAEIRQLIANRAGAEELAKVAAARGLMDFRAGGLLRVARGVTSIEEVMRSLPVE